MNIEKNIPIPEEYSSLRSTMVSVLKAMEIGDSFVIPRSKRPGLASSAKSVRVKIATRAINDTEVRVWKVGVQP